MSDQRTTFALTELSVHELCSIIGNLRDGINVAEKERNTMRARVAELEAQIAAHERVCAGSWKRGNESYPVSPGTYRWRNVTGDCCGQWTIEVRVNYEANDVLERCIEAWNAAPRGSS